MNEKLMPLEEHAEFIHAVLITIGMLLTKTF
jgi:hypothetical protein